MLGNCSCIQYSGQVAAATRWHGLSSPRKGVLVVADDLVGSRIPVRKCGAAFAYLEQLLAQRSSSRMTESCESLAKGANDGNGNGLCSSLGDFARVGLFHGL